jgi:hypothetical protein
MITSDPNAERAGNRRGSGNILLRSLSEQVHQNTLLMLRDAEATDGLVIAGMAFGNRSGSAQRQDGDKTRGRFVFAKRSNAHAMANTRSLDCCAAIDASSATLPVKNGWKP